MAITPANIHFNESGTPVAEAFDDVYFSNDSGIDESKYVFIDGNNLLDRWKENQQDHFVIAETGFGTGLNFLTTWFNYLIQRDLHSVPKLHFISTEKYPLDKEQLKQALQAWPSLSGLSEQLIQSYPFFTTGCHRIVFNDGQVILDLWFGDAITSLEQLYGSQTGLIDAWFLDGFAPSKNDQMWQPSLFKQMQRLTKNTGTVATFTAAGIVKRGLQEHGFDVTKQKGFGRKREMICASFSPIQRNTNYTPYFIRTSTSSKQVAVIGGGVASALCNYHLLQEDFHVTQYYEGESLASGASGNHQGGLYPLLNGQENIASQLQANSFDYAVNFYQSLAKRHQFGHAFCGVLQVAHSDTLHARYASLYEKKIWPEELIQWVDSQQASQLAGISIPYPSLYIPKGGWISPPELINGIHQSCLQNANFSSHNHHTLQNIERVNDQWILHWKNGEQSTTDVLVLTTGIGSLKIPELSELQLQGVRGQVEVLASTESISSLKTVLCHKGYFTPAHQERHCVGATYIKDDLSENYRLAEQQKNIQTISKCFAGETWISDIHSPQEGRASVRCCTPDHLPLMGQLPDISAQKAQYPDLYKALPLSRYPEAKNLPDLYTLTGLGSRGLSTAPLLAAALVSQICGKPLPFAQTILDHLNPNRFLIKQLIRREIE
jgi:tRNA 5-methylaminomethyl-2-thiouridine biosynthesis bifunctional protein